LLRRGVEKATSGRLSGQLIELPQPLAPLRPVSLVECFGEAAIDVGRDLRRSGTRRMVVGGHDHLAELVDQRELGAGEEGRRPGRG
jgi:hypothetical protein